MQEVVVLCYFSVYVFALGNGHCLMQKQISSAPVHYLPMKPSIPDILNGMK